MKIKPNNNIISHYSGHYGEKNLARQAENSQKLTNNISFKGFDIARTFDKASNKFIYSGINGGSVQKLISNIDAAVGNSLEAKNKGFFQKSYSKPMEKLHIIV